jgi:hypothetical protein
MRMKKINNIKDLQIEKMRLRIRQLEQEKNLQSNWAKIKNNLNPDILVSPKILAHKNKETLADLLISGGLGIGAGFLTKKLTEFTGRKIESAIQKGVGKLTKKINAGMQNKT